MFGKEQKGNSNLTIENLKKHTKRTDKEYERQRKGDGNYKVKQFILDNPVSAAFLKREKGKLPYSVFKATQDTVLFQKSLFKGRPPSVFFTYPSYV